MGKVLIVYYSMYGHIHQMAQAVAEGVRETGCEAILKRVPETLSQEVLGMMGALEAQQAFSHIPIATVDDLAAAKHGDPVGEFHDHLHVVFDQQDRDAALADLPDEFHQRLTFGWIQTGRRFVEQ